MHTLEGEDFERLDRIRWCPRQFQAFVEGTNVRVHTIGTRVFATAIHTQATDYRYAQRQFATVGQIGDYELRLPRPAAAAMKAGRTPTAAELSAPQ